MHIIVDLDTHAEFCTTRKIKAVPTFILYDAKGVYIGQTTGANMNALSQLLQSTSPQVPDENPLPNSDTHL